MTDQKQTAQKSEAEKKAAADAKAAKKAQAEQAKAEKKAAKEKAKADKEAAKAANKMPEQNGVRRPKPGTKCGLAWAIFDELSAATGAPTAIGPSLAKAKEQNLNEANVRAEYARWRKFHGITGRIAAPAPAPAANAAA